MLPTTIHTAPSLGDFVLLSEYQSTTPQSFHDGKPVLHYHAAGAKAWLPKDQQQSRLMPVFPADAPTFAGDAGDMIAQDEVELFINSETLTIFNTTTNTGIQVPYPSIALHAMQHKPTTAPTTTTAAADGDTPDPNTTSDTTHTKAPCVLLQLDLSDGGDDDDTFDTLQLTLLPPPVSTDLSSPAQEGSAPRSEQEKLFDAITACQNLHPDPAEDDEDDDDDDYADRIVFESAVDGSSEGIEGLPGVFRGSATGDLPPPMPGSTTGWITAENVGDFFDADGNWIGGGEEDGEEEELGEGAGRVRARHELNGHENGDEDEGGAETKRPRTE